MKSNKLKCENNNNKTLNRDAFCNFHYKEFYN